jgi:hypothetical protein
VRTSWAKVTSIGEEPGQFTQAEWRRLSFVRWIHQRDQRRQIEAEAQAQALVAAAAWTTDRLVAELDRRDGVLTS